MSSKQNTVRKIKSIVGTSIAAAIAAAITLPVTLAPVAAATPANAVSTAPTEASIVTSTMKLATQAVTAQYSAAELDEIVVNLTPGTSDIKSVQYVYANASLVDQGFLTATFAGDYTTPQVAVSTTTPNGDIFSTTNLIGVPQALSTAAKTEHINSPDTIEYFQPEMTPNGTIPAPEVTVSDSTRAVTFDAANG